MARPLSMKSDNNVYYRIQVSVSAEVKRFLIDNNLSPSQIITRHVENLRELATYRYERIIQEKQAKVEELVNKVHKLFETIQKHAPEKFDEILRDL